jgi:hypothetical protein
MVTFASIVPQLRGMHYYALCLILISPHPNQPGPIWCGVADTVIERIICSIMSVILAEMPPCHCAYLAPFPEYGDLNKAGFVVWFGFSRLVYLTARRRADWEHYLVHVGAWRVYITEFRI